MAMHLPQPCGVCGSTSAIWSRCVHSAMAASSSLLQGNPLSDDVMLL